MSHAMDHSRCAVFDFDSNHVFTLASRCVPEAHLGRANRLNVWQAHLAMLLKLALAHIAAHRNQRQHVFTQSEPPRRRESSAFAGEQERSTLDAALAANVCAQTCVIAIESTTRTSDAAYSRHARGPVSPY
jgi:hypothetical protein